MKGLCLRCLSALKSVFCLETSRDCVKRPALEVIKLSEEKLGETIIFCLKKLVFLFKSTVEDLMQLDYFILTCILDENI